MEKDTEQFLFVPEITPADVLIASNCTRNLAGSQTDPLIAKAAILTGYFVMPEFVFPNTETVDPDKYLGDEDARWGKLIISFYQLLQLKGEYTNYFDRTAVVPNAFGFNPVQLRQVTEPKASELPQLHAAESKVFSALPPGTSDNAPALPSGTPQKVEVKVLSSQGSDNAPALPPGTFQKVEVKVLSSQGSDNAPALPPGTFQKVEVKVLSSQGSDNTPALPPGTLQKVEVKTVIPKVVPTVKVVSVSPAKLEPLHTEQEGAMKRVEMLPPGGEDDETTR
jgi:hypothetical protein